MSSCPQVFCTRVMVIEGCSSMQMSLVRTAGVQNLSAESHLLVGMRSTLSPVVPPQSQAW